MSSAFSSRPMHAPELRPPVQGTPLTSGMSGFAAVVVNPPGEFGTMNGVHTVVKVSSSSPASHAASGTECVGCATSATAGVMAIAMANPPARRRRVVIEEVVIRRILRMLKAIC